MPTQTTTQNRLRPHNVWFAATPPTVSDGVAVGKSQGDLWFDTTGKDLYICAADTAGAAVWRPLFSAQGDEGNTGTTSAIDFSDVSVFIEVRNTTGAVVGYLPMLLANQVTPD